MKSKELILMAIANIREIDCERILNILNMKDLNIKKVIGKAPDNQFEAIELLNKAQQQVIDSIHIMQSIIDNPQDLESHTKRIEKYLNQFK